MILLFVKPVNLPNKFFNLPFILFKFFVIFSKKSSLLEINRFQSLHLCSYLIFQFLLKCNNNLSSFFEHYVKLSILTCQSFILLQQFININIVHLLRSFFLSKFEIIRCVVVVAFICVLSWLLS